MSGPDGQCPAETFFALVSERRRGELSRVQNHPLISISVGGYTAACAASPARNGLISPTLLRPALKNLCQIYAIRRHKQAVTHVNGCDPTQTDFSTVDRDKRRVSTGGAKMGL